MERRNGFAADIDAARNELAANAWSIASMTFIEFSMTTST
jgi:hypothetical protein